MTTFEHRNGLSCTEIEDFLSGVEKELLTASAIIRELLYALDEVVLDG